MPLCSQNYEVGDPRRLESAARWVYVRISTSLCQDIVVIQALHRGNSLRECNSAQVEEDKGVSFTRWAGGGRKKRSGPR